MFFYEVIIFIIFIDSFLSCLYAIQRLKSFRKAKDPHDIHADAEKPEALTGSPYSIEWPFGENDTLGTNLWKIVSLPLILCMKFTIPDTRFKSVQDVCGGYIEFEQLTKHNSIFETINKVQSVIVCFYLQFLHEHRLDFSIQLADGLVGHPNR